VYKKEGLVIASKGDRDREADTVAEEEVGTEIE
jgi:hypothetical protein